MNILNSITEGITGVLFSVALWLDRVVYSFINYLYKLFLVLAQTRIISSDEISGLIRRIYVLIGVVMLFVLAYGLLNAVINPAAKDKNTSFKTIVGVIKAIVLIAVVPTIFDLAYSFQVAIVRQNTIGRVILGNYTTVDSSGSTVNASDILNDAGINMAVATFQAFVVPIDGKTNQNAMIGDTGMSLQDVWDEAIKIRSLKGITILSEELKKDANTQQIEYSFLISTLAGGFLVWQLLKYCLSLGSRCIKLAFYELIAPAPILLSIMPSKKKLLSDWLKDVVTLFLEVFIRILVLYIAVFLITVINTARQSNSGIFGNLGTRYSAMGFAILIMGLISFISSAPDLVGKALGVDSSNLKKGMKDTLKEGGLFALGGMAGGAVTGLTRGVARGVSRGKKAVAAAPTGKKGRAIAKAIAGGVGTTIAGGFSAGFHGFRKDAGTWKDMKEAASAGATYADKSAKKRFEYKAKHGGKLIGKQGGKWTGSLIGHVSDLGAGVREWSGFSDSSEDLRKQSATLQKIADQTKKLTDDIIGKLDSQVEKSKTSYGGESLDTLRGYITELKKVQSGGVSSMVDEHDNPLTEQKIIELVNSEKKRISESVANRLLSGRNSDAYTIAANDNVDNTISGEDVNAIRQSISEAVRYTQSLRDAGIETSWIDSNVAINFTDLDNALKVDGPNRISIKTATRNLDNDAFEIENKKAQREKSDDGGKK